jgi:hypothetical protein
MKTKIKNPALIYLARNIWISTDTAMIIIFLGRIFEAKTVWVELLAGFAVVLALTQVVLTILDIGSLSKAEQKAEFDERSQMILGKASKWTFLVSLCICLAVSGATIIFEAYTIGLVIMCFAFFNQALFEILKAVFSKKY